MDGIVDLGAGLRFGVAGVDRQTARLLGGRVDPYSLEPASRHGWQMLGGVSFVVAGANEASGRAIGGTAVAGAPRPASPHRLRPEIVGDAGDGIVAAWDGVRLRLMAHDGWCVFPDPLGDGPPTFEFGRGFLAWSVGSGPLELAIQIAALDVGGVVVHGSAVELDGRAIVIGGWSESGKTEAALGLLARGAGFISDKWTYLAPDGTVRPFPARVGVRGWAADALPAVRALVPAPTRWRQRAAGLLDVVLTQRWAHPRGRASAAALLTLGRLRSLAERASVAPSRLDDGDSVRRAGLVRGTPLGAVVMLSREEADEVETGHPPRPLPTSDRISVERFADPAAVARRFARSAAAERPLLRQLFDRWAFATAGSHAATAAVAEPWPASPAATRREGGPTRPIVASWPVDPEVVRASEEVRIAALLERATILGVRTPFPAHPLALADVIASAVREGRSEPAQAQAGAGPTHDGDVDRVPVATVARG